MVMRKLPADWRKRLESGLPYPGPMPFEFPHGPHTYTGWICECDRGCVGVDASRITHRRLCAYIKRVTPRGGD